MFPSSTSVHSFILQPHFCKGLVAAEWNPNGFRHCLKHTKYHLSFLSYTVKITLLLNGKEWLKKGYA